MKTSVLTCPNTSSYICCSRHNAPYRCVSCFFRKVAPAEFNTPKPEDLIQSLEITTSSRETGDQNEGNEARNL
ncbi:hypothetical protein GYMLUDRAFT_392364 [Collybiopsis luxurians FD-317 M1]|uniref:Uncharacterized protein n=1 Tax=Collybiopsis luxurians FD-317 M1 TaxID=944289 RepID=A0A0D0C1K1_9AGAR|nr:hypothetical protein GYMLUDRAFT_392364 [Collybiopsis luxurians FD-317 M1]